MQESGAGDWVRSVELVRIQGRTSQKLSYKGMMGWETTGERPIDFLCDADMVPVNTWFQQPPEKQRTYRKPGATWTTP